MLTHWMRFGFPFQVRAIWATWQQPQGVALVPEEVQGDSGWFLMLCSYCAFRKQLWHFAVYVLYVALLVFALLSLLHFQSWRTCPWPNLSRASMEPDQANTSTSFFPIEISEWQPLVKVWNQTTIKSFIVLNVRLHQAIDNGNGIVCEQPNGAEIVELVTWTLKAAQ